MNYTKTICVVGSSGLVGSSIVRCALEKGYAVNGTLRNKLSQKKSIYLKSLPGANRLKLFNAEMNTDNFLEPLKNTDVVYIACLIPKYKGLDGKLAIDMEYDEGYREIINPTVKGCLNILKAARKSGVNNAVICSSTSSTNSSPPVSFKNEVDHWSNEEEQCKAKKYTSATKTVMEKKAIEFCKANGIRLSIIMPTGLYGDAILPNHMEHNPFSWLKRLIEVGEPRHETIPNDSVSMIHLRDLANIFLSVYENPSASGRYFGVYDSLHWQDIYLECKKLLPKMKMPNSISDKLEVPTSFDFTRRNSLGVEIRDFPTLLKQTIDWIKSDPFKK